MLIMLLKQSFCYRVVDNNEEFTLLNIEDQDKEERYFDDEEPDTISTSMQGSSHNTDKMIINDSTSKLDNPLCSDDDSITDFRERAFKNGKLLPLREVLTQRECLTKTDSRDDPQLPKPCVDRRVLEDSIDGRSRQTEDEHSDHMDSVPSVAKLSLNE